MTSLRDQADQLTLLLTRCGYSEYVIESDTEPGEQDFVWRNKASRRQRLVGWTDTKEKYGYTIIQPGTMPHHLIEQHIADEDRGIKHCDPGELIDIFLPLMQIAIDAGLDPRHSATALDLFRYHCYPADNQAEGYIETLHLVAGNRLDYKTMEKLLIDGKPYAALQSYGMLNPALVRDLLHV